MDDSLIILGSGGGRHHIRTQHRATGGILYKHGTHQVHVDPGPGAIVRVNQYHQDPTKTDIFICTHFHLDHFNDLSAVVEASRTILHDRNHVYFKKGTLITTDETLKYINQYHLNMLEKIISFKSGDTFHLDDMEIVGLKVIHSKVDGFGVRINLKDYSIAFSSDTRVFEGFSEQLKGVNVLILNLLRPDSITCNRHLCTDEVIPYLNKIQPNLDALIITHFGSFMDGPRSKGNHVPEQVKKLISQTNIKHVIAAEDGLNINVKDLLEN